MRYDWISEFSINRAGHLMPNWFAIFGMVFGFVILPLILFWLTRRERAENFFSVSSFLLSKILFKLIALPITCPGKQFP